MGGAGLTDLCELFGFDEGGRYHCVVRVTHRVEPLDRKQARWTVSVSTEEPRCLHAVVFAVDDGIGRELPVRAPPFELTRTSALVQASIEVSLSRCTSTRRSSTARTTTATRSCCGRRASAAAAAAAAARWRGRTSAPRT